MTIVDINFSAIAPLITLATAALVVLVLDLILPAGRSRPWAYAAALAGVALSFWYTVSLRDLVAASGAAEGFARITGGMTAFGGAYIVDRFGLLFGLIVLTAAFLAILLSFFRREEDVPGYLALVMWAAMGMMVLAGAGNFLTLFLGLELFSLSLYVLVAFGERDLRGKEAGLKYLVLGSVASAAMLYGLAFIYGQTGSVSLASIFAAWSGGGSALLKVGVGLVMLSFAFKLALVPFHTWAPDVYQGAPAPITAFMTVGTRAAAFAALVRFLMAALPDPSGALLVPLWVLAVLSMIVGSLGACVQGNVKRILAYSGIAHAGYLMLALVGLTRQGISAAAFYFLAYLFMNVGALAIVVWLSSRHGEGDRLEDLEGLFHRRPVLAALMTLFMLSLIGFPTTAGFSGKLLLASAALASGAEAAGWLVGALAVTSAISAYAYLRVVMVMFGDRQAAHVEEEAVAEAAATEEAADATGPEAIGWSYALALVVAVCAVGTVYLGLMPGGAIALASNLLPLP